MNYWNMVPLFRLLLPFAIGTVCGILWPSDIPLVYRVFPVALLLGVFIMSNAGYTYKRRYLPGLILNLLMCAAGYCMLSTATLKFHPMYYGDEHGADWLELRISEPLKHGRYNSRAIAEVTALREQGRWKNCEGRVLLYFRDSAATGGLDYGSVLLVKNGREAIPPPQNPFEYNYRQYLSSRGIYDRIFPEQEGFIKTGLNRGKWLIAIAYAAKSRMLEVFRTAIPSRESFAVASALLIGHTGGLDPELVEAYAHSGTLHVLSVSGMHVGIIYIVLAACLKFMERSKVLRITRTAVLLAFLWMYALITGFSPPVLRASVMLSLVIIGKSVNRNVNTYNILSASALGLLLYNPYYISDTGFQLSYLALTGILVLQPVIYSLYIPKNVLVDKAWELTAASLSAQIFTFPLTMLYFGQFPNYFIAANLVIIPLSTLAIYLSILVLMASFHPVLSGITGKMCNWMVEALNASVRFFDGLPGATASNYIISVTETVLLYSVIIFISLFCFVRDMRLLRSAMLSLVLALALLCYHSNRYAEQRKIIVYKIRKHTAIDFIDGNHSLMLTDEGYKRDMSSFLSRTRGNWAHLHIHDQEAKAMDTDLHTQALFKRGMLVQFHDRRMLIADKLIPGIKPLKEKIGIDYLLVSNNAVKDLGNILSAFHVRQVIADATNSRACTAMLEEECRRNKLEFHSVARAGAFIAEF